MPVGALILGCWVSPQAGGAPVVLFLDADNPRAVFAGGEVETALQARGHRLTRRKPAQLAQATAGFHIILAVKPTGALQARFKAQGGQSPAQWPPEGFSLRTTTPAGQTNYWVLGADSAGVMYGGLELAELIRIGDLAGIPNTDQQPYMAMRGTKFNCPLDVRTPSYTDVCDAAQNNIAEMWNFAFWKEYIDTLARYRYNFISLWSLHPFPSLVKVPDYPEVALADVQRSTVKWQEYYSLNGRGFDAPEILNHVETLKRMTIEDKIDFWRRVMRYGKERNVDFYVVTWNIFVNGTFGKYGITDSITNATTRDYFRQSVKQLFLTYPDLKGIGLTTGENMPRATTKQKEDWAFATYGQGVLDAARAQPGRKITFLHRQHQSGAIDIARRFAPLVKHPDIEFIFSFKYAKAHVYSSTRQPYHQGFVRDIQQHGELKTIWTLRNDDIFYLRWGAPDFVREFIQNIPYDVSRGFYYGSDQYIWGREFLSKEPETPRQIEIAKHWYQWLLWGRLGYNPDLSNERFVQLLQARYPEVSGRDLFTAWQEASLIYPETTGFHWGALDFQWYIEGCKSSPGPAKTASGFHDVNRFIGLKPNAGTDYISIPNYVKAVLLKKKPLGTTPLELSQKLHAQADTALNLLAGMKPQGHKELRLVLSDIRSIAYLGKYYAHKIRGATQLAFYHHTDNAARKQAAILELNRAAEYWRLYVSQTLGQYRNPLWMNRVGHCDWRKLFQDVLHDVEIAEGKPDLRSMPPTPGGTIAEAEKARLHGAQKQTRLPGFTGAGYAQLPGGKTAAVEWTYDAPHAGTYLLEVRYVLETGQPPAALTVNGRPQEPLILWPTGGPATWGWDRQPVRLRPGANTIRLSTPVPVAIDHLNVLDTGETD